MVKIVVLGALGRMGKRIIEFAEKDPEIGVVGKVELKADPAMNIVDNIKDVKDNYDCIIDFTAPESTMNSLKIAKEAHKAIVIGTTGLSDKNIAEIKNIAFEIPVVFSPNMSVGVNVFFNLVKKASSLLIGYKPNIAEAHHVHKKDKPSGTAKKIAEIVKKETGISEIPTESLREGEIVGYHEITFESEVDTIKISHSAKTRDIFVFGALKAAKFLAGKDKGFYSMSDVLGIKE
jgi:4-hydroxy-tetrahydrodipicolinate reductase